MKKTQEQRLLSSGPAATPTASAPTSAAVSHPPPPARWGGRHLLLLAATLVVVLNGLGAFPLHEPDEGRYAAIAASMAQSGDWLTPRLSGLAYYQKPPLFFWLGAAATSLLGKSEWAVRLPSALASLLTVLLVVRWVGPILGSQAALGAGLALLALPLFAIFSHVVLVDPTLTLLTTAALYAGYRGLVEPGRDEAPRKLWVAAAWLAGALAFLTKGPIGLVLPFSGLCVYLAITRQWRRILTLARPEGLLLFALVVAPWYVAMAREHPGYLYDFFWEQNLQRFATGGRFGRAKAFWFYVPLLLGTFFPWSLLLGSIGARTRAGGRRPRTDRDRLRLLLACAVGVPFLILSVAQSKLPYYLLPLAPPFAILAIEAVLDAVPSPRTRRWGSWALTVLGVVVLVAAVAGIVFALQDPESIQRMFGRRGRRIGRQRLELLRIVATQRSWPVAVPAAAAVGALFLAAARALRHGRLPRCFAALGAGVLACALAAPHAAGRAGAAFSYKQLAEVTARTAGPETPVVSYGFFPRGVAYYLGRPLVQWRASRAEFGHRIRPEASGGLALQEDRAALQALLRSHPCVVVLAGDERDEKELLALSPVPLRRVATLGRRLVLLAERDGAE